MQSSNRKRLHHIQWRTVGQWTRTQNGISSFSHQEINRRQQFTWKMQRSSMKEWRIANLEDMIVKLLWRREWMNWWFLWFFTMLDDEVIHSLFTSAAMKETNECFTGCFRRGKIYEWCFIVGNTWNNSSVLQHENNHKASTSEKKSKENKIVKKLKNKIQQKRQRKRNWNVRASERIINWCVRKSEMLLRTYRRNKMIRSHRNCC